MEAEVTVIINVRNGALFVEKAIDSVLAQTYAGAKILVFDNISTDRTAQIVKERYALPNLQYHQSGKDMSLGEARREAIAMVTTDYYCFLDVDDWFDENSIKERLDKIKEDDYAFCISGHYAVKKNKIIMRYLPKNKDQKDIDFILRAAGVWPSGLMINRKLQLKHGVTFDPNLKISEEVMFALELALREKFCSVKKPLFYYLVHDNSLTSQNVEMFYKEREYIYNRLETEYADQISDNREAFDFGKARINYYKALFLYQQGDRKMAREELKKIRHVHKIYFFLYSISYFPFLWKLFHNETIKYRLSSFIHRLIYNKS